MYSVMIITGLPEETNTSSQSFCHGSEQLLICFNVYEWRRTGFDGSDAMQLCEPLPRCMQVSHGNIASTSDDGIIKLLLVFQVFKIRALHFTQSIKKTVCLKC